MNNEDQAKGREGRDEEFHRLFIEASHLMKEWRQSTEEARDALKVYESAHMRDLEAMAKLRTAVERLAAL